MGKKKKKLKEEIKKLRKINKALIREKEQTCIETGEFGELFTDKILENDSDDFISVEEAIVEVVLRAFPDGVNIRTFEMVLNDAKDVFLSLPIKKMQPEKDKSGKASMEGETSEKDNKEHFRLPFLGKRLRNRRCF